MNTLEIKEGQTYVCTESVSEWWTEGKEYTVVLNSDGIPALVDDENDVWTSAELNGYYNEFKLREENKMSKLDLKEGQTYICTDTKYRWWTEGKEYKVLLTEYGTPVLVDDCGDKWFNSQLFDCSTDFKLKTDDSEQTYTPSEVNKVIIKTYQLYDNDSQRLAYLKGYFAK